MIKIVVADDEEDVRNIIADFIDSSQNKYQVVGRAENGEKALELVKEYQPDILISDICMPVMDGLELITAVNALDFSVKSLIVSGYSEFEYAKKAIKLGVSEYLLKPFLPDELLEVLDKMSAEIDSQIALQRNLQSMESALKKSRRKEREAFVYSILEGECDDVTFMETAERLEIAVSADMYCVCELRCRQSEQETPEQQTAFARLFENVSEAYFDSRSKSYLALQKPGYAILLFTGEYQNDITFRNEMSRGLLKIAESMKKYYQMDLFCFCGGIYHDWKKVKNSWKEAENIWKGMLDSDSRVLFYSDCERRSSSFDADNPGRPEETEHELLMQIQMNRKEDALHTLDKIMAYYQGFPLRAQSFVAVALMQLLLDMCRLVEDAGGNSGLWDDARLEEYLEKLFRTATLFEVRGVLAEYAERCCQEFSKLNASQGDKIVSAVKALIEENISNEEFNLDTISAELYFSIHYIRQVFKQKTGDNILEYLIKRRMEVAEKMLKSPENKIVDIAEKTGYKNQRYFATAFKKYYGCTPTEYRSNL